MIYVRDKGRLANNILQFAHVYAWAREQGRVALSMRFAYKYPGFAISHSPHHNIFRYLFAKYGAAAGWIPVVAWDDPDPTPAERRRREEVALNSRNVVIEGWWVRYYDLFLKYLDEIKTLFAFTPEVERSADALLKRETGAVCKDGADGDTILAGLHVRRGDYARWNGGRYLYDAAQYAALGHRLLTEARRRHPAKRVRLLVCGNDPALDRSGFPEGTIFSTLGPAEDLCLLSRCALLAGPPSTFSLVAAMYHDRPLAWIYDPQAALEFGHFDTLFRKIL